LLFGNEADAELSSTKARILKDNLIELRVQLKTEFNSIAKLKKNNKIIVLAYFLLLLFTKTSVCS